MFTCRPSVYHFLSDHDCELDPLLPLLGKAGSDLNKRAKAASQVLRDNNASPGENFRKHKERSLRRQLFIPVCHGREIICSELWEGAARRWGRQVQRPVAGTGRSELCMLERQRRSSVYGGRMGPGLWEGGRPSYRSFEGLASDPKVVGD